MINDYKTIIFDCDGVILNSNKVKKDAYYRVACSNYGKEYANLLVEYLSKNTGKTRDHFFNHFLTNIVPKKDIKNSVNELTSEVSLEIHKGLMKCDISKSIFELRKSLPDSLWLVASGGVELELKDIFTKRLLFDLFDGGIYGGPNTKDEILSTLMKDDKLEFPAVLLGDSRYDYDVANRFNLDFVFISNWSDFKEWKNFCNINKIPSIKSLNNLL